MFLSRNSSLTGIVQKGSVTGLAGSLLSIFWAVVCPRNSTLSAQLRASLTMRMASTVSPLPVSATFMVAAFRPAANAPLRLVLLATGDAPRSTSKTTAALSAVANAAFSSAVPGSILGLLFAAVFVTDAATEAARDAGGGRTLEVFRPPPPHSAAPASSY